MRVMRKHRAALKDIDQDATCPKDLLEAAKAVWDEVIELGEQHGFRNAQATVLAPTGTIGFMMDCDTTGRRAGHRAGQVQEAGRRRDDEDRQPDRADGAHEAGLQRDRRSRRSSSTSTSTRRSKGRRTSRSRTSRCSTARSSRRAACARSTTWATSR